MVATTTAKACLKVCLTDGAFTAVGQLHDIGVTESTKNVDVTPMGFASAALSWSNSTVCMLRTATFTGSGFFDYGGDTTGQRLIMDNANNGADLWFKYWYGSPPTGVNRDWVKSKVVVTDFTIKTSTNTMVEFSFTAESDGAISRATDAS